MNDVPDNMVEVRDAYKSFVDGYSSFNFSRTHVFKGLNMTVETGSIYALLGPSGCGKTTLLKCIIGQHYIDAGKITLKVKDRFNIGYMPQDLALVDEITIKETLNYYGWIYGVRGNNLEERKKALLPFLDVPPERYKMMELSGGQKRRISLCLALLHNPELLILDEPTVGIDPILSHSIWQYLLELSTVQKKTIILTTHYIEEAKQSNRVGMMRGGVLVVEGKAQSIMDDYGSNTLEEVFVKLSYIQESEEHDEHADGVSPNMQTKSKNNPKPLEKPKLPLHDKRLISFNCFVGYFLKNLYQLKYSSLGWFFIFFIPISTCLMFQYSLGRSPLGLKVGIVNEELSIQHGNCENFSNFTCFPAFCGYYSLLETKNIIVVPYNDTETAFKNFVENRIQGFLHIPENFTESLQERLYRGMSTSESAIEQSEVKVWVDTANKVIREFLKSKIYLTYFDYLKTLSLTCQWPVNHSLLPIQYNEPVYGKSIPEFSEFSVPGLLLTMEFFLPVADLIPILQDKRSGIIERSLISGLTYFEILAAYSAVTMLLFLVQTACSMIILYGIFGRIFEGSVILALTLICLVGFNGLSFGLFVAVLCNQEIAAAFAVTGALVCICSLGGMFWTPEGMHYILQEISVFLPLSLGSEAYRAITSKAWTLSHPVVYSGFISVILWILIFSIATYGLIKIKRGIGK